MASEWSILDPHRLMTAALSSISANFRGFTLSTSELDLNVRMMIRMVLHRPPLFRHLLRLPPLILTSSFNSTMSARSSPGQDDYVFPFHRRKYSSPTNSESSNAASALSSWDTKSTDPLRLSRDSSRSTKFLMPRYVNAVSLAMSDGDVDFC